MLHESIQRAISTDDKQRRLLYRAEQVALLLIPAAYVLTVLIVGWGAVELNGVVAVLVTHVGWPAVGAIQSLILK